MMLLGNLKVETTGVPTDYQSTLVILWKVKTQKYVSHFTMSHESPGSPYVTNHQYVTLVISVPVILSLFINIGCEITKS